MRSLASSTSVGKLALTCLMASTQIVVVVECILRRQVVPLLGYGHRLNLWANIKQMNLPLTNMALLDITLVVRYVATALEGVYFLVGMEWNVDFLLELSSVDLGHWWKNHSMVS